MDTTNQQDPAAPAAPQQPAWPAIPPRPEPAAGWTAEELIAEHLWMLNRLAHSLRDIQTCLQSVAVDLLDIARRNPEMARQLDELDDVSQEVTEYLKNRRLASHYRNHPPLHQPAHVEGNDEQ